MKIDNTKVIRDMHSVCWCYKEILISFTKSKVLDILEIFKYREYILHISELKWRKFPTTQDVSYIIFVPLVSCFEL